MIVSDIVLASQNAFMKHENCQKTTTLNHFLNFSVAMTIVLFNQYLLFRICIGLGFVIEISLIFKPNKFLLIFCGLPIKSNYADVRKLVSSLDELKGNC